MNTEKHNVTKDASMGKIILGNKRIVGVEGVLKKNNDGYIKSKGIWIPEKRIVLPN